MKTDDAASRGPLVPRPLLALNVLLLVVLAAVTFAPASANTMGPRSSYMMVSGNIPGAKGSVIWIVDTSAQEMLAVTFRDIEPSGVMRLGYRNIGNDAAGASQSR